MIQDTFVLSKATSEMEAKYMGNCAIVGINWGDEGKGRMVDLLTAKYDIVVRFQGGHQREG